MLRFPFQISSALVLGKVKKCFFLLLTVPPLLFELVLFSFQYWDNLISGIESFGPPLSCFKKMALPYNKKVRNCR